MDAAELIVRELHRLQPRKPNPLTIVETGSIRGVDDRYATDDGWSTLTFARQVQQHGGMCYSIDLDISAAETVLGRHGLAAAVTLVKGHSIDVLAGMLHARPAPFVDVAYLDSGNDAGLILHEFLLLRRLLRRPALLLVDDIAPAAGDVVKGHQLMPWLDQAGVAYRIEQRTGAGYSTGVLVADL